MSQVLLNPHQLGHVLQAARKAAKLSQSDLATSVGVSQSRVSKLELNPGMLSVDQLFAMCSRLGLELLIQKRGARASDAPSPASEW